MSSKLLLWNEKITFVVHKVKFSLWSNIMYKPCKAKKYLDLDMNTTSPTRFHIFFYNSMYQNSFLFYKVCCGVKFYCIFWTKFYIYFLLWKKFTRQIQYLHHTRVRWKLSRHHKKIYNFILKKVQRKSLNWVLCEKFAAV